MRPLSVVMAALLGLASPAAPAADRFASDKPSPLRLLQRGDDGAVTQFTGKVRIAGRFRVAWDVVNRAPRYLRVTFLPDVDSAMLLPHAVGSAPVGELLLSNNEAAAKLLLDRETVATLLAKEILFVSGEATVEIGDYRSVVACDQRTYLARLLAVTSRRAIAVAASEGRRDGC